MFWQDLPGHFETGNILKSKKNVQSWFKLYKSLTYLYRLKSFITHHSCNSLGIKFLNKVLFQFLTSGFWQVVFGKWFLTSGFWQVVFDKWFLTSGFWQVLFDKWFLTSGFWQVVLTSGFWQVVFDKWFLTSCFWQVVFDRYFWHDGFYHIKNQLLPLSIKKLANPGPNQSLPAACKSVTGCKIEPILRTSANYKCFENIRCRPPVAVLSATAQQW